MKRAVVLALIGLLVFGVWALAGSKQQKVNESCFLRNYWLFQEFTEYDLWGTGYQVVGATGWFKSTSAAAAGHYWHCKVTTNRRLKISFDFSKAQFKHIVTSETLPTEFLYKVTADKMRYSGIWYSSYNSGWRGWDNVATTSSYFGGFQRIDPAYLELWAAVAVYRNGYHDRSGTYLSEVSCLVSTP